MGPGRLHRRGIGRTRRIVPAPAPDDRGRHEHRCRTSRLLRHAGCDPACVRGFLQRRSVLWLRDRERGRSEHGGRDAVDRRVVHDVRTVRRRGPARDEHRTRGRRECAVDRATAGEPAHAVRGGRERSPRGDPRRPRPDRGADPGGRQRPERAGGVRRGPVPGAEFRRDRGRIAGLYRHSEAVAALRRSGRRGGDRGLCAPPDGDIEHAARGAAAEAGTHHCRVPAAPVQPDEILQPRIRGGAGRDRPRAGDGHLRVA